MKAESVAVDSLVLDPSNARKHSPKNLEAIKGSLAKFGQQKPIVVGKGNVVIAGNGTLEAARALGWDKIAVVRTSLEGTDATAFAIADNRTGELAEWDAGVLGDTLKSLQDLDFDLESIGFSQDDLDKMIATPVAEGLTDPDEIPEQVETRCKPGDLWILGNHRLLCGDSTNVQHVERLMNGEKADVVHTDPPYNVDYSNADRPKPSKKDLGKIKNDAMPVEDFATFLSQIYANAFIATKLDASFYIWYADRSTLPFYSALEPAGLRFSQMLIWKKPMLLGRNRYQFAHEPCIFAVKGSPHFTDDRTKTTVWDFGGYDKSNNVHPTQKPTFLPKEAIGNSSRPGDAVLDLFLGSGSTLIACEEIGRRCFGMELDPKYCDVILTRWEQFTGKTATLETRQKADG